MVNPTDFITWATGVVNDFGYLGIFGVALLSSATIVFPTFPLSTIVFFSSTVLNPILVAIAAGIGAATGELVGFFIGYEGERLLKKYESRLVRIEKLFQKYHPMVVIYFFSAIPIIPFDIIGLFGGLVRYPAKNFYIALLLGKTTRYLIIAAAGYYGLSYILSFI